MPASRLDRLSAAGVSIWIDTLSRELLASGGLARLMREDAVVGVTSNPTIFQQALATGDLYDAQLREAAATTVDPAELFFALALDDIRAACDLMEPVWASTGGVDGWVSLEVDPTLAYERERTFEQARRLSREAARPNVLVKIPATEAGLGAIEDSVAAGTSVNVTLIFSLGRYRAVVEAYLRGLERLVAAGGDPARVASVASFFVSRVDSETDRRLEALGRPDLAGRLAVANAKLAYQHWLHSFSSPRWRQLAAKGASPQRCLWASTSTKNPSYRDVLYVEELVGEHTVNTMPPETVRAFADHGEVRGQTLVDDVEGAHELLAELAAAGVDYDDVVAVLEAEGIAKFAHSFAELLAGIEMKTALLRAA